MPRWLSSAPRKKLPPPTTMATCVPPATTSAISSARACATSGSTPILPPPNTSPDSLSSTRRYQLIGCPLPADEPADDEGAASISLIGRPLRRRMQVFAKPYRLGSGCLRGADLEVEELGD